MHILLVGSGAREHALAWRLAREGHTLVAAPGNPGIARHARCAPTPLADVEGLVRLARAEPADLVVVGPEAPLEAGLVDALAGAGVPAFGPTRAAARLETSKVFAKEFMARHGVPTAAFRVVTSVDAALDAARAFGYPAVLKADGLAAGKGVVVAGDERAARAFASACLEEGHLGAAGSRLVVETFLPGTEASLFFLVDGARAWAFPAAQDFKRLGDSDRGPNTGGMGAVAPLPVPPGLAAEVETAIVAPTLQGMAEEGHPFRGLLYVGLMRTDACARVVEFNARFGDPETQALMPLVAHGLGDSLLACALGRLDAGPTMLAGACAVAVVLAAAGYPSTPRQGDPVTGLAAWPDAAQEDAEALWCFHAGTRQEGGELVAAGGRVLTVVARDDTWVEARARAYAGLARLALAGGQQRGDIGRAVVETAAGRARDGEAGEGAWKSAASTR
jgi:phosphoribosylamine--glycine ligase